ncbi:MAG: hypothetical protein MJ201_04255 [Mycoplasmoidaceae bacterium]|nr:hypothetical protein [Mycoplasmoidaceae bacterium]
MKLAANAGVNKDLLLSMPPADKPKLVKINSLAGIPATKLEVSFQLAEPNTGYIT